MKCNITFLDLSLKWLFSAVDLIRWLKTDMAD